MTAPLVVATIVNWNGRDLTLRLLRSLQAVGGAGLKIIIVDNASSDGSVEAIRKNYPEVEIISLPKNIGYSGGINEGLKRAAVLGTQYHWVFNNDVEVMPDTLTRLIDVMKSDEKVGIAGPLVLDSVTGEIAHAGYKINMWLGRLTELGGPPSESPYEVDSAFGCSNLIRASILEKTGLFDPGYNVYFDETDFNMRARRCGYKVVVAPQSRVRHEESATMNRRIVHKAWLLLKNLMRFELKNAKSYQLAVFLPYYFFIHIPYFLIRGSFYAMKLKSVGDSK